MDTTEIFVLIAGAGAIVAVVWYFFLGEGERAAATVDAAAGVQQIKVTVKSGYSPDVIVVKKGVPVELNFYRDEANSCTEQVVFADFGISRRLPAFQTTPVRLTPEREGEFTFTCGMSMVRGKLVVEA